MCHKKLSLRSNIVWAFVGNLSVAFFNGIILIVLTKIANVTVVGQYAIAQAIALPIQLFFTFKLRTVQITDHQSEFLTTEYLGIRFYSALFNIACASMLASILYSGELVFLIVVTSIGYSILIIREYYIAELQKKSRMDLVAVSNFCISILVFASFIITYYLTNRLTMAIVSMFMARFAVTFGIDRLLCGYLEVGPKKIDFRYLVSANFLRQAVKMVKVCFSMGLVALLSTLFISVPRLALERYCGVEEVGYFAALSSLLVVISLFTNSLSQVFAPILSRLYLEDKNQFVLTFFKFVLGCLLFSILVYLIVQKYGEQIIVLVFNEKYLAYTDLFSLIILSGALLSLFSAFNIGLSAQRKFVEQLPIYAICAGIVTLASFILIPKIGINGGAYAYMLCNIAGITLCGTMIAVNIKRHVKD
jgi:O-antigen/teichoic acid export membrane protein